MPRSRRSYGYQLACRLGDGQAHSIVMAFDCSYSQGDGDEDRRLTQAKLILARRYAETQVKTADRVSRLYDRFDEKKGEMHGLGCVIDNSRNIAFREVLEDVDLRADLAIVEPGDQIKETAAETIVQREFIISNMANRFGRGHIAIQPVEDPHVGIPVDEIREALEGVQARPTAQHKAVTVLPELDHRDDVALCFGLGVLYASYMAPESENWLLHQSTVQRPSFDWVV